MGKRTMHYLLSIKNIIILQKFHNNIAEITMMTRNNHLGQKFESNIDFIKVLQVRNFHGTDKYRFSMDSKRRISVCGDAIHFNSHPSLLLTRHHGRLLIHPQIPPLPLLQLIEVGFSKYF